MDLQVQSTSMPVAKMPGHWVLARLGKRVLRPGGLELTKQMLKALEITGADIALEFAPGLGETARRVIPKCDRYIGIYRDINVLASLAAQFRSTRNASFIHASAEDTGLDTGLATVLWGEAMLSMKSLSQKEQIVREAARLLTPGGRYGIHELCFSYDGIDDSTRQLIKREMSLGLHVGVQLATQSEWCSLLMSNGFDVLRVFRAPMHLLEPARLLRDEGILGVLRILRNALRDPDARRRALAMRALLRRFESHLTAICLIAVRRKKA